MVNTKMRLIIFFATMMEKLYTVSKNKTGSLTVAQIMSQIWTYIRKVGKTTRPLRYDLNQIPYYYSVEVTNRFKGLHLIDRVPEELWTEVCNIVQEAVIKTILKEKKCQKTKYFSEICKSDSYTLKKINSKWVIGKHVTAKIMKLGKNMDVNICDVG